MNQTPLLLDSFKQDIPLFSRDGRITYKSVSASSTTTKACVPPRLLLCSNPNGDCEWIKEAESLLQTLRSSSLENTKTAFPFPEVALDTEAELSGAFDSQILQPIFAILHHLWGGKFTCHRESHSEAADGSKDISMRLYIVFKTANGEQIVVLELKRRELIRYEDFAKPKYGLPSGLIDRNSPEAAIEERLEAIRSVQGQSVWKGNAVPFLKQTSKFANGAPGRGCPYVALFNWDHLQLLKFDKENLGLEKLAGTPTAGETAELTWISEHNAVHNTDRGGFIRKASIRKALLGYMLEAFEARLGKGKTL